MLSNPFHYYKFKSFRTAFGSLGSCGGPLDGRGWPTKPPTPKVYLQCIALRFSNENLIGSGPLQDNAKDPSNTEGKELSKSASFCRKALKPLARNGSLGPSHKNLIEPLGSGVPPMHCFKILE